MTKAGLVIPTITISEYSSSGQLVRPERLLYSWSPPDRRSFLSLSRQLAQIRADRLSPCRQDPPPLQPASPLSRQTAAGQPQGQGGGDRPAGDAAPDAKKRVNVFGRNAKVSSVNAFKNGRRFANVKAAEGPPPPAARRRANELKQKGRRLVRTSRSVDETAGSSWGGGGRGGRAVTRSMSTTDGSCVGKVPLECLREEDSADEEEEQEVAEKRPQLTDPSLRAWQERIAKSVETLEHMRAGREPAEQEDDLQESLSPAKSEKLTKTQQQQQQPTDDTYRPLLSLSLAAWGRRVYDSNEYYSDDEEEPDDERPRETKATRMKKERPSTADSFLKKKQRREKQKGSKSRAHLARQFGLWDDFNPKIMHTLRPVQKTEESPRVKEMPDWERTLESKIKMAAYEEDFNRIVKSVRNGKTRRDRVLTGKYLIDTDLEWCKSHTKFKEGEIIQWFKSFRAECPRGHLGKGHLNRLFKKVFPTGDGHLFCNHIFRIFDKDNNGFLDFKEFLMAVDVTTCKTIEDKMSWAFKLFDIDGNGTIDLDEMTSIIEIMDDLEGNVPGKSSASEVEKEEKSDDNKIVLETARQRAEQIYQEMDTEHKGAVTLDEFVSVGSRIFGEIEDDHQEDI